MVAKQKISEFDAIAGASVASGDKFIVLDVSDTSSNDESGAGGTVKSITATELASVPALTSAFVNVTGETAAVDLTGASSVSVPAASAANHAAQVTAIDASLGRLAIGGYEIGDTGWREMVSWTAGVQDVSGQEWTINTSELSIGGTGSIQMRRVGNTVHVRFPSATANTLTISATTANSIISMSSTSGMRADTAGMAVPLVVGSAYNSTATADLVSVSSWRVIAASSGQVLRGTMWSYPTTVAWPTSLPGTAA